MIPHDLTLDRPRLGLHVIWLWIHSCVKAFEPTLSMVPHSPSPICKLKLADGSSRLWSWTENIVTLAYIHHVHVKPHCMICRFHLHDPINLNPLHDPINLNPLRVSVKCRRQSKIFKLFQNFSIIQILLTLFGFSMKNAFKWVQTSLVLDQWFLR